MTDYIDTKQLAARLGVSTHTLKRWRVEGNGPPYVKLVGSVRYPLDEAEKWEAENLRRSTSG